MVTIHRRLLGSQPSMSPANDHKLDSYIRDTNFDTNMVIILAVLLFALVFALGLNFIVRCAISLSRRFGAETAEGAAARLKRRVLRRIPVAVYGSGGDIPATECPICLGEFVEGEKVRVLPKCGHGFHVRCIDMWLVSHSSCPNCRHSLLDSRGVEEFCGAQPAGGVAAVASQTI
ncbi:hypothetical protein RJ639_007268 [Escallonia herrerae]|uniref:RING-type E3 ubiquitin transferase n=1 Tax=Escallonia herrerae TaxID=1293975 RepID=A0AA88VW03_9ASTE|nr:hypothetical protein RJ639_007268 [Escallonia herrerae]